MKLKWIFRIIGFFTLLILILVGILIYYFQTHKADIVSLLNQKLQSAYGHKIQFDDIKIGRLNYGYNIELEIDNILLLDSLYPSHQIKTLEISKLWLHFNAINLLFLRINFKDIVLENAQFNLFQLENSYTNGYLLNLPKSTGKSRFSVVLDKITIRNTSIKIDQQDIFKKYEFYILETKLFPNLLSANMNIKTELDFVFKKMVFKTANGSFLTNAHIKAKPILKFDDTFISFQKTSFLINETPYKVAVIFGVQPARDTIDLRFSSDQVIYNNTIPMLSPNIEALLKNMNFKNFIQATASIVGHFSDVNPKIRVDFDLVNNQAILPKFKFEQFTMKGFFDNQFNKKLLPCDENSEIRILELDGKNKYTLLESNDISITNVIYPTIHANISLSGNVLGLKDVIPQNIFEVKEGNYKIRGLYDDDIEVNLQKLLNIKGEFEFENLKVWIPKYKYLMSDLNWIAKFYDRQLHAREFNFKMYTHHNKVHVLKFNSSNSIIEYKDKFRLFTDCEIMSHPEIFEQFTKPYHFVSKNGMVKFKGIYNDYLYFNIDSIPNIIGSLNMKDMDFQLENYPLQLMNTNADLTVHKSNVDIDEFSTMVNKNNDTQKENALHFYTDNTSITLGSYPIVHSTFRLSSQMKLFNGILQDKSIEISKGNVEIDGKFDGKISGTYQNLDRLISKVKLKNVSVYLKSLDINLEQINGEIHQDKRKLDIPNLDAYFQNQFMQLSMQSEDVIDYWLGLQKTTRADIRIQAPNLNIQNIVDITQTIDSNNSSLSAISKNSGKRYILKEYNSYEGITGNVHIHFGKLQYHNYSFNNFDFSLSKTQDRTNLNYCKYKFGDGKVFISALMKKNNEQFDITSELNFENISLAYLKSRFTEYLPKKYNDIDIEGLVRINSKASFSVYMNDQLVDNSINATSILSVGSLNVKHFNRFINMPWSVVSKPFLNHIEIHPFHLNFKTTDGYTILPKTLIRTTIADVWIGGQAAIDSSYRINTYLPFYNFSNYIKKKKLSKDSFFKVKNSVHFKFQN